MSNGITALTIIGVLGVIWVGCLLFKRYIDYITYDKKVLCIHCATSVPRKSLYGEYCSQECYEYTSKFLEEVEARKEEELQLQTTRAERRLQEERDANLSQWSTLTEIKYQHDKHNDFSEPFCNLVRGLLSAPEDFDITVMFSEVSVWSQYSDNKRAEGIPRRLLDNITYTKPEGGIYHGKGSDYEEYKYLDVKCKMHNLHKLPLTRFNLYDFTLEIVHKPSKDTHILDIAGNHTKEDTWLTGEERFYLLSNALPEYVKNYLVNKDEVEQLAQSLKEEYSDNRYKRDTMFMLNSNPFVKVETILSKVTRWTSNYIEEDENRRIREAEQKAFEDKKAREKQLEDDHKRDTLKVIYKTYE